MWLLPGKGEKGDWETGGQGDKETRGWGDGENGEAELQGYFK